MILKVGLLIVANLIAYNETARILAVFPLPLISHQLVYRSLTQELAKRGHDVVVITTDPIYTNEEAPQNFTEIDIHEIAYGFWQKMYEITTKSPEIIAHMKLSFGMVNSLMEIVLQSEPVQKIMKEGNFDLLLLHACVKSTLLFNHVFKAPVIQVSSFGPMSYDIDTMGMAWHPFLYPLNLNRKLYDLTLWDKIKETWNTYWLQRVFEDIEVLENEMAKRVFGSDVPTIKELRNNVDLLMLNVHPIWESNRPVPPSVVYVGGMNEQKEKALPSDLKDFLDSSKNGVIYISFGTNVKPSLLPREKLEVLTKVLSEVPYSILWKYDADTIPGQTDNMKICKWLPQQDVLRHPKIKAFVTHGGLQSTQESINAGVPLVGIPFFSDQWYNTEKYVHFKIGVQLNINTLNTDDFKKAINTVVHNISYRENVVKLRELMLDQPQRPLERAVWWTEHVLRHGGAAHLRSPAANISWTQYLEIELVSTIVLSVAFMIMVSVTLIYNLYDFFTFDIVYYFSSRVCKLIYLKIKIILTVCFMRRLIRNK